MDAPKFLNNTNDKRYELHIEDQFAFVDYMIDSRGVVYLTHTETPDALKGKGVASKLIELTFKDLEQEGHKMSPLCPFVRYYINEHPEWQKILVNTII